MNILVANTNKHINKVRKSIQNKLFDLLVDLDDELAHGYDNMELNVMLKANIIKKILVDLKLMSKIVVSNTTTVQDITFLKMRDNTIEVQNIINYDKAISGNVKNINQLQLYKNPNPSVIKESVKKYQINMVPLYNYMKQQKSKNNINKVMIQPKMLVFKDLQITANRFKILKSENLNKINIKQSINDIFNEEDENKPIQIVINDLDKSDSESNDELEEIKQQYTQSPFILSDTEEDEIQDTRLKEQRHKQKLEKFNNMQKATPYIGKKSISHRDKDRQKYIGKLVNSMQDVD
jgi:hypothetical protein